LELPYRGFHGTCFAANFILAKEKTMTLHHFKALAQDKQRKALLQKGAFVADRMTAGFCIYLFQIDKFYVEIFFIRESDEIIWIKCFDNTDELEPYLTNINISSLLN
jgi:hypothetical protein